MQTQRVAHPTKTTMPNMTKLTRTIVVTVHTSKAIPDLLDKIAARAWTIDGVVDCTAREQMLCPDLLPAHLQAQAAAQGAERCAEALEQGD